MDLLILSIFVLSVSSSACLVALTIVAIWRAFIENDLRIYKKLRENNYLDIGHQPMHQVPQLTAGSTTNKGSRNVH